MATLEKLSDIEEVLSELRIEAKSPSYSTGAKWGNVDENRIKEILSPGTGKKNSFSFNGKCRRLR